MTDPVTHVENFVTGFHEERTEDPHPHPILGVYYRQGRT